MHINMLNEVMNCKKSITKPEICMAATKFVGSDRYAMVVTEVINNKTIRVAPLRDDDENNNMYVGEDKIQRLKKDRIGNYVYVDKWNNKIEAFGEIYTYRKNKRWMRKGNDLWGTGAVHLGYAETYLDPSF